MQLFIILRRERGRKIKGRSVKAMHLNVILVYFSEAYVRLNVTRAPRIRANGAESATKQPL